MSWVIDTSVALRWFLAGEQHPHAEAILEQVTETPTRFAVPELFTFEVYAVLERLHANGQQVFTQGILPLLEIGILRQPMTREMAMAARRFVSLGLTGYDACYAALASELEGQWLTFDARAHRRIRDEGVSIDLNTGIPQW